MIELIPQEFQLKRLEADIAELGEMLIYAFLIEENFFENLFGNALKRNRIHLLGDHRQRSLLRRLVPKWRTLEAATWSYNRTMHSKNIIFPSANVCWLTSANLNRGAWTLSQNTTLRIIDHGLTIQLRAGFYAQFEQARPIMHTKIL